MYEPSPSPDRDDRGLFRPDNTVSKGVGGNPNSKRMAELKQALIACGTVEDVQKLFAALLAAALDGDTPAAKLLLDHLVGRPAQTVEVSGTEGEPVRFNMAAFMAVITTALADYPEAQYKLAAALKGVRPDGGPDRPDGLAGTPA
jgi:hypothetical protein